MQNSPCKPVESNELTPEKQSKAVDDINKNAKTSALKESKKTESEFITPEKSDHSDQWVESEANENLNVKENSTPSKELKNTETYFRTPEKTSRTYQSTESEVSHNDTPKKACSPEETKPRVKENSTPLKETKNKQSEFKTPDKTNQPNESADKKVNETPGKTSFDLKLEQACDGEDGMISTTEQARLLIAASKTPSKSVNKTPVKQNTPSGKRSVENSPITPGKHRRVELITLASPKAKRLKQI